VRVEVRRRRSPQFLLLAGSREEPFDRRRHLVVLALERRLGVIGAGDLAVGYVEAGLDRHRPAGRRQRVEDDART